jgi:hypothetical protein
VLIHVPHPRHDSFLNDPTHVRPITPHVLELFDREANELWRTAGAANTPLALYTGVDFKIASIVTVLAEPFATQHRNGELTPQEVDEAARWRNNVIEEFRITLLVRKPEA